MTEERQVVIGQLCLSGGADSSGFNNITLGLNTDWQNLVLGYRVRVVRQLTGEHTEKERPLCPKSPRFPTASVVLLLCVDKERAV